MKFYSFAGPARGKTDPEEVHEWEVEGECFIDNMDPHGEPHTVMMWSGNEYSKNHTWIAAEEDAVIDLEQVR